MVRAMQAYPYVVLSICGFPTVLATSIWCSSDPAFILGSGSFFAQVGAPQVSH